MPKLLPCPGCSYTRSWTIRRHHRKCKKCRKEWSPYTFYPLKGFRLNRREWHKIMETFLRDKTIKAVSEEGRIAYVTAQKAVRAIRIVMCRDTPLILCGTCEADETYVGGAWKNKAVHIRKHQPVKRGRGTSKQAVFGVLQRHPLRARIWLVKNCKGATLRPLVFSAVRRGSFVYTDGHKGYRPLKRYGYHHDWVDHENNEYVRGEVHTQTIDGYWGLLKTRLDSIGGIRKKYLHLFIGEHQWRYNFHHLSRRKQVKIIYQLLTKFGGRF